jgi:hypothetical protein
LFSFPAAGEEPLRNVVLATQRDGRLHFLDAASLDSLGYLVVHDLAESVRARPDGLALYVQQAKEPQGDTCCSLFAIDLESLSMCELEGAAGAFAPGVPSADGTRVHVAGLVYDSETLLRMPGLSEAERFSAGFSWLPSPDGRWLAGVTRPQQEGPSVEIVDAGRPGARRRVALPADSSPAGADWVGGEFFVFSYDGDRRGTLWSLEPHERILVGQRPVYLPLHFAEGGFVWIELRAGGGRLFLYEAFGHKLDRRSPRDRAVAGGLYEIEPSTGHVLAHVEPTAYLGRVRVSSDGKYVYALDTGRPQWRGPVRLLRIDAASGRVLAERPLETDVWNLELAAMPEHLVPHGRNAPKSCASAATRASLGARD